jgi:hypothetical protein
MHTTYLRPCLPFPFAHVLGVASLMSMIRLRCKLRFRFQLISPVVRYSCTVMIFMVATYTLCPEVRSMLSAFMTEVLVWL